MLKLFQIQKMSYVKVVSNTKVTLKKTRDPVIEDISYNKYNLLFSRHELSVHGNLITYFFHKFAYCKRLLFLQEQIIPGSLIKCLSIMSVCCVTLVKKMLIYLM